VVVKAAGLAKGKGVIVCNDPSDAILAAEDMLVKRKLGSAGATIVVEERLLGREASLLAVVDGHTSYLLEPAQDHKRLRDGDEGPNTGGMGAFCPSPLIDAETLGQIETQILVPTLDALVHENIPYRGVLYLGLIMTTAGPRVLEFNCRFGDPETQAILMRLRSDFLDLLNAAVDGGLEDAEVAWDPRPALCVVMASGGYPDKYETGLPIAGVPEDSDDVVVDHAGTRYEGDQVVTAGGRVLGVTALGETLADARRRAYDVVSQIHFEGAQYRTDLGAAT
jgi:phosphoribosylamine--glycine ligase